MMFLGRLVLVTSPTSSITTSCSVALSGTEYVMSRSMHSSTVYFGSPSAYFNYSLEFVKYALGEPKYTVEECIERDMTYSVPLKATLQLVVMEEVGEVTKTKRPKNIDRKNVV